MEKQGKQIKDQEVVFRKKGLKVKSNDILGKQVLLQKTTENDILKNKESPCKSSPRKEDPTIRQAKVEKNRKAIEDIIHIMQSVTPEHITPEIKTELVHIYKRAIVLRHLIKAYKEKKKLASKSPFEVVGAGTVEKPEEMEVDRQPTVTDITFYFEQAAFKEANASNPEAADGCAPRKVASGLNSTVPTPGGKFSFVEPCKHPVKGQTPKKLPKNNEQETK